MFKNIISKIRQVMYSMGLMGGIKKVTDRKEVMASDSFYEQIRFWKSLYKGFHKDWHEIGYETINGHKTRKMETLGMPKVISQEMANLVFNEKCDISIDDGEGEFHENIKNVLDSNAFYQNFQDYLEYMFALGGKVIKTIVTKDKKIKLAYVSAESFVPIADDGRTITEGVFIAETHKGDFKYTQLEWHTWEQGIYVVRNELYRADKGKDELGVKVPLDILPQYAGLEEEIGVAGLTRPMFVYFRPNIANNIEMDSKMGISLYANAVDTLHSLDTAFDSFHREFRLGKKRIMVPDTAIRVVIDSNGNQRRYFDADDEVYQAMAFGDDGDDLIKDMTLEIRVEEHVAAINALLEVLAMQTGFSPGTFTFDSQGLKTATEVISENSKTYKTRASHITLIEEGLKDLVETISEVAALYGIFTAPDEFDMKVNFDDSIAEDRTTNATYWITLVGAGLASKLQAIQKVQKVTEDEALTILRQIMSEDGMIADPVDEIVGE